MSVKEAIGLQPCDFEFLEISVERQVYMVHGFGLESLGAGVWVSRYIYMQWQRLGFVICMQRFVLGTSTDSV